MIVELSCGNPGDIIGAMKSGSSYVYGDVVMYTVIPGYTKGTGDTNLTCGVDGRWQGNKPEFSRQYIFIEDNFDKIMILRN